MRKKILVLILFLSTMFFVSCGSSGNSEDKTSYNYMTFTVDGVQKEYSSIEDWGFLTDSDDPNLYWNAWNEDWDADDTDYVVINIPDTVATGTVYTDADTPGFSFELYINGDYFNMESGTAFVLTITEWGSIGNIIRGTFYGTITNGTTTKVITDGIFEATNNTDQTKK